MSVIKVEDVAFVRFRAPDLDAMESFLSDFGLVRAERSARALFMRGAGAEPFLHVTELGDAGFAGVALRAGSLSDLERLAAHEGVAVERSDEPGGGHVVRLTDPNGFAVEVVAGRESVAALPVPDNVAANDGREKPRLNDVKRIAAGPAHVLRLGHCVLNVADFRASEAWYKARFGFITSDEIELQPGLSIGAFMRCDRGEMPSDHHTLFLLGTGTPAFNHAAFEVADLDDLMAGHEHLKAASRKPEWGVGRHVLGSQVFDYWSDPWGHKLEHWTDGDLLSAGWGSRVQPLGELLRVQWGQPMPATFG